MEYKKYFSKKMAMNPENNMQEEPPMVEAPTEQQGDASDMLSKIQKGREKALKPIDAVLKDEDPQKRKEIVKKIDDNVAGKLGGSPLDSGFMKKYTQDAVQKDPKIQDLMNQLSALIS